MITLTTEGIYKTRCPLAPILLAPRVRGRGAEALSRARPTRPDDARARRIPPPLRFAQMMMGIKSLTVPPMVMVKDMDQSMSYNTTPTGASYRD